MLLLGMETNITNAGFMSKHNFYFRCKACNRPLKHHTRKDKEGRIQESELCSVCTGMAFDSSPYKEYSHSCLTDIISISHLDMQDDNDF